MSEPGDSRIAIRDALNHSLSQKTSPLLNLTGSFIALLFLFILILHYLRVFTIITYRTVIYSIMAKALLLLRNP